MSYIAPQVGLRAFNCPHCGAFARQSHYGADASLANRIEMPTPEQMAGYSEYPAVDGTIHTLAAQINYALNAKFKEKPIRTSICEHCGSFTLWVESKMVHPNRGKVPPPSNDMPADVKEDYEEAAQISEISSRGAAALLRLAIQKLCKHLGGNGENINEDIKSLVKNGLPPKVQMALDIVRVTGNNAVHPGEIDTDDPKVVGSLFALVNLIVEYMITVPNQLTEMYAGLPPKALEAISKRDTK